jgi:hypothetical protein
MKNQLIHRMGIPHVHHVLGRFNKGEMTTAQAMAELGVSRSRLFALRKDYLDALRDGTAKTWIPACSGGARHTPWPAEAMGFLRMVLAPPRPYSYAFAASEMERLHAFHADRAQVRLWAIRNKLAHVAPKDRPSCHQRRWQRSFIGELWQLDATPFPWFGAPAPSLPMINMLDDCSRQQVGGCLYHNENLESYIHFLASAFERYGLPLQIYVDQATFFKPPSDGGSTQIQNRLKFYDVSFIFANSPESKGKIERLHQVWQDRLPPFFAKNGVPETLDIANAQLSSLIDWRNTHDIHRETGMRATEAWGKAIAQNRCKLRPKPQCPWWNYVWSLMTRIQVGTRGRVSIDLNEFSIQAKPGSRVVLCTHVDGTHSILADIPRKEALPKVLFTNRAR